MPRNVLIVGMARSGTSLTAGVFARLGYFVGERSAENIREGDDHNPFGYFEADRLVEENRAVLRAVGFRAKNTWQYERISDEAVEAIRSLPSMREHRRFIAEWDRFQPWLWKDPHLCLTLSYWCRLLPSDTAVVLVQRDAVAIYQSFRRMGWADASRTSRDRVIERISQHMQEAERVVRELSLPHVTIAYEDYRKDPDGVAARLSSVCDMEITGEDLNFHADLDHTRPAGRVAAILRIAGQRIPQRYRDAIERAVPRRVLGLIFPERRYGPKRVRGREVHRELRRRDVPDTTLDRQPDDPQGRPPRLR